MNQKEKLIAVLGVTPAEADAILDADAQIDKGADLFPLDAEQRKVEKKMRQADRKPTTYKFTQRERKKNELKGQLIAEIAEFLQEKVENLAITNADRMISFEKDGKKFEITLTQKRK